ncbi:MAG: hypothetical protein AB8B99_14995 [Phormidesmis sp.]
MSSSNRQDKLSAIFAAFWEEISPKVDAYAIPSIQGRIEEWVGTQPELTEVLCKYAVQYASQINDEDAESAVDAVVRKEILKDWENSLAAPHLHKIQEAVLRSDRRDSLLIAYIQILQRKEVTIDNSPEQFALLASGLVKRKNGKLSVDNDLYANVFDAAWVEKQIPGITKPVTIISPQVASNKPSASAKLYSKWAIAACGLAVVGAAISSYVRESGGEAMATPEGLETESALTESALVESIPNDVVTEVEAVESTNTAAPTDTAKSAVGAEVSDRQRFDAGEEHAKNSRWVKMMREFCAISPESVYFTSAQNDLVRWKELYSEDLKIAMDVVSAEQGETCAVTNIPTATN